jgi:hypothetical protein
VNYTCRIIGDVVSQRLGSIPSKDTFSESDFWIALIQSMTDELMQQLGDYMSVLRLQDFSVGYATKKSW